MQRFAFRLALGIAMVLFVALGALIVLGFAALAFYLYLTTLVTAPLAALATAFAILLFLLILALIASLAGRGARRRREGGDPSQLLAGLSDAMGLGQALGAQGRAFTSTHLSKTAITVFGLGFAIGLSPKLRRLVSDLLLG